MEHAAFESNQWSSLHERQRELFSFVFFFELLACCEFIIVLVSMPMQWQRLTQSKHWMCFADAQTPTWNGWSGEERKTNGRNMKNRAKRQKVWIHEYILFTFISTDAAGRRWLEIQCNANRKHMYDEMPMCCNVTKHVCSGGGSISC